MQVTLRHLAPFRDNPRANSFVLILIVPQSILEKIHTWGLNKIQKKENQCLLQKLNILSYIFDCFQIILLLLPICAVISYNFEYFTRKYYFVVWDWNSTNLLRQSYGDQGRRRGFRAHQYKPRLYFQPPPPSRAKPTVYYEPHKYVRNTRQQDNYGDSYGDNIIHEEKLFTFN